MSDLARLPSYPSPTTLIARSGIQFLDFGFDPVRLKVREWGFHDAAADKATGRACAWSIWRPVMAPATATSRATATAPFWPSTPV
ncbi:MAG: hypothetical protein HYZ40_14450 [Rhodospirillales bacterium]|nr:hypothetical protein [Rhodospirillales bacterium]